MSNIWISKEFLISLAESNGHKVNVRMFDRWRKNDLFPRPQKRSLDGSPGSEWLYPPGTDRQLLALCRLHFSGRAEWRFDELRLALWCEGFDISEVSIKQTLQDLAVARMKNVSDRIRNVGRDNFSRVEKIAAQISIASLRRGAGVAGALHRTRRRIGDLADIRSFFTATFQLFAGTMPEFSGDGMEADLKELSLQQIFERGLGIEAGRTASIAGASPWLAESDLSELKNIPAFIRAVDRTVKSAKYPDLIKARNDWHELSRLHLIARALKQASGHDVFGAQLLTDINGAVTPFMRAVFISYFLWCRHIGQGPQIDKITTATSAAFEHANAAPSTAT